MVDHKQRSVGVILYVPSACGVLRCQTVWRGGLYPSTREWFPAGEPDRALFRASKLAMTSVVILAIWLTDLQLFRGIPFGKWGIFTFDSIKGIKEGLQCYCATHSALACHQRCQQRKEVLLTRGARVITLASLLETCGQGSNNELEKHNTLTCVLVCGLTPAADIILASYLANF